MTTKPLLQQLAHTVILAQTRTTQAQLYAQIWHPLRRNLSIFTFQPLVLLSTAHSIHGQTWLAPSTASVPTQLQSVAIINYSNNAPNLHARCRHLSIIKYAINFRRAVCDIRDSGAAWNAVKSTHSDRDHAANDSQYSVTQVISHISCWDWQARGTSSSHVLSHYTTMYRSTAGELIVSIICTQLNLGHLAPCS